MESPIEGHSHASSAGSESAKKRTPATKGVSSNKKNAASRSTSVIRRKLNINVKDPNAPKQPQTGYLRFTAKRRAELKEQNPTFLMADITRILGQEWSKMTDADKEPYMAAARADRVKYQQELNEYLKSDSYRMWRESIARGSVLGGDLDSTASSVGAGSPAHSKTSAQGGNVMDGLDVDSHRESASQASRNSHDRTRRSSNTSDGSDHQLQQMMMNSSRRSPLSAGPGGFLSPNGTALGERPGSVGTPVSNRLSTLPLNEQGKIRALNLPIGANQREMMMHDTMNSLVSLKSYRDHMRQELIKLQQEQQPMYDQFRNLQANVNLLKQQAETQTQLMMQKNPKVHRLRRLVLQCMNEVEVPGFPTKPVLSTVDAWLFSVLDFLLEADDRDPKRLEQTIHGIRDIISRLDLDLVRQYSNAR
eukprot:Clim_evm13s66 gene=Clim_evmTU13s66